MNYNEFIYVLRIIIAGICGLIIGLEREKRLKEAGIRTHCLVACGAALMMVLSKYGFFDSDPALGMVKAADPARIAAQVVSGIGFLGAGMIFVHKDNITGLTTAAGIWTTAGIGMTIGAGMYLTGIAITFLVVILQIVLHFNKIKGDAPTVRILSIHNVNEQGYQDSIISRMDQLGVKVNSTSIEKNCKENTKDYAFLIEMPCSVNEEDIISQIDYNAEIKVKL